MICMGQSNGFLQIPQKNTTRSILGLPPMELPQELDGL